MTREYKVLRFTLQDSGVAEVVFTEAKRGNPIDLPFCEEINALSIELANNAKVRAVLIRSEGKAFSYGGDLHAFAGNVEQLPSLVMAMTAGLHAAIARLQRMNAPIVGAIHGVCAGGMTAFMAGCDLLVAAEEAAFLTAYAGIGFSCDAGSSVMLTRRMGLSRARRFLLLNETIDARAALAAGLVDEVVAAGSLHERAMSLATRLAAGPTRALGETRRLLLSASEQPLETQLELEAQALTRVSSGDDAKEGVAAFVGKRKPNFVGR